MISLSSAYRKRTRPAVFKPLLDKLTVAIARKAGADAAHVAEILRELSADGMAQFEYAKSIARRVGPVLVTPRLEESLQYSWGLPFLNGTIDEDFHSRGIVETADQYTGNEIILEYYPEESRECIRQGEHIGGYDSDIVALWNRGDRVSICHAHPEGFWILGEDLIDFFEQVLKRLGEEIRRATPRPPTPNERNSRSNPWRTGILLWAGAMVGVVSLLPVVAQVVAMQGKAPLPLPVILLISTLQSGVLVTIAVLVGVKLAPRVGLGAPWLQGNLTGQPLRHVVLPGLLGGLLGGVFISVFSYLCKPLLPPAFLEAAAKLTMPWYSRLLYGGITEEILIRWGLMTFLVWVFHRLAFRGREEVAHIAYWFGIVVAAGVFGALHLPFAKTLAPTLPPVLIAYVLIANGAFGIIAGYLYRRRGLEAAIIAHACAHVVMISLETIFPAD